MIHLFAYSLNFKQFYSTHRYDTINIYVFISIERVKVSIVWETDGGKRMETAIFTHDFFISWPSNTVLSSRPHLGLRQLLSRGLLNRRPAVGRSVGHGLSGTPSKSLVLPWLIESLMTASWDSKTKTPTAHISRGHRYIISKHPHISVQPRDCFCLFSLVRPVQRISDWRIDQGSICNTGGNIQKEVLYSPHSSRTGASPPDSVLCYALDTLFKSSYSSEGDTVEICQVSPAGGVSIFVLEKIDLFFLCLMTYQPWRLICQSRHFRRTAEELLNQYQDWIGSSYLSQWY